MRSLPLAVALSVLAACRPPPSPGTDAGTQVDAGVPLRVTSVQPASGPASGGTVVTVTGAGFTDGVALYFGDAEATDVARVGENRLTAKTPQAALAGEAVEVRVVRLDGIAASLPAGFTYDAAPGIAEAVLVTTLSDALESLDESASVTLSARVKVPGKTESTGAPAGVRAQVGFGAHSTAAAGFSWTDAAFSEDAPPDGDVFAGAVAVPVPGGDGLSFDFAARFSVDDGASWTLASPVATATVRRPLVHWCKAGGVGTGPEAFSLQPDAGTREVYAQLYHPGLTEAAGAASGLEVEWGVGTSGSEPGSWAWSAGTFNVQNGNDDEWKGLLSPPPAPGEYRYAPRARLRGGPWRLCDGDGSDNGFDVAQAGKLTVTAPSAFSCTLGALPASSLPGGDALAVTVSSTGSGLRLQVGLGAAGSDPATSNLWGWMDVSAGGAATLYPAYTGQRAVAARASDDNGQHWTVCGGMQALSVTGVGAAGYCNLQFPSTVTVASAAGTVVYGRVYAQGVTEAAGAPGGVAAELGFGKSTEDPGAAWSWAAGSWNVQVGNDDEFQGTLPAGAAAAGTSYAWRFKVGSGYCYGDLDGNTQMGAFSGEVAGGQPNLGGVLP